MGVFIPLHAVVLRAPKADGYPVSQHDDRLEGRQTRQTYNRTTANGGNVSILQYAGEVLVSAAYLILVSSTYIVGFLRSSQYVPCAQASVGFVRYVAG